MAASFTSGLAKGRYSRKGIPPHGIISQPLSQLQYAAPTVYSAENSFIRCSSERWQMRI